MKILQLCKKMPLPQKDGEAVAVLSFAKAYKKLDCEIDILAFNTSRHYVDPAILGQLDHPYGRVEYCELDTRINHLDAFLNLFTNKSYNIERFISYELKDKLINLIQDGSYDVIQLESLYMAPYIKCIRENSDAKVIMRSHNIESQIWRDLSKQNSNPVLKWYYALCSNRLNKYEQEMLGEYDLLFSISQNDYDHYINIDKNINILNIPVGIDLDSLSPQQESIHEKVKLGYLGSLDWKPNIEGLLWFFNEVWAHIDPIGLQTEFHLAGRNPVDRIKKIDLPGLVYHGEVESASEFLDGLDVVVVPLFSGSGIRVKILESMAKSKLVISTDKGFEGIDVLSGVHAEKAQTKEDFISLINKYAGDVHSIERIGRNAREFIKTNFDTRILTQKAKKAILELN